MAAQLLMLQLSVSITMYMYMVWISHLPKKLSLHNVQTLELTRKMCSSLPYNVQLIVGTMLAAHWHSAAKYQLSMHTLSPICCTIVLYIYM